MKDLLEICCGLDVHRDMVVACLLKGSLGKEPSSEIREFSALLSGLEELKNWPVEEKCQDIAMESTGVYRYVIYNVLEAGFEGFNIKITVTNPQRMKNAPCKKADIKDAQWIALLLRAGSLQPSYVPPKDIRELRELTRYRRIMIQQMSAHKNRIEKYLQQCGFKLSAFLSDVFGTSGKSLIGQLCKDGYILPNDVINHLYGTARRKESDIRKAINGKLNENQRIFLSMLMEWLEKYEDEIIRIEERIMLNAEKYRHAIDLVCTMPSIQEMTAITIISEIGVDLSMFKTSQQLCSWAGMSPGSNISAGKNKSTKASKGNAYIKCVLCQCSWGITRCRKTYLSEWFWKLKQRRGSNKAIVALGRKVLTFIYHILNNKEPFDDSRHKEIKIKQEEIKKKRIITEAKKYGLILAV